MSTNNNGTTNGSWFQNNSQNQNKSQSMNQYAVQQQPSVGTAQNPLPAQSLVSDFLTKTYGWMAFALLITGLAAYYVGHSERMIAMLYSSMTPVIVLMVLEFGLVIGISALINRISASMATLLFVLYSLVNGLTLGSIFLAFTGSSIASTFGVCTLTFGAMAVYGMVTKRSLDSVGKICFFGVIGLVIAGIVNLFLHSSTMSLIVSALGVIIFVGLTAYDSQKIKQMAYMAEGNEEVSTKLSILGALTLYLDFVNLFLYLLRFMGNKNE